MQRLSPFGHRPTDLIPTDGGSLSCPILASPRLITPGVRLD